MSEDRLSWIPQALAALEADGLLRHRLTRRGAQGAACEIAGQQCVNFGANDYLGLATDPRLAAAAHEAIEQAGWGSAASPLLAGQSLAHARLEADLANFEGTEAALVFPTGFAANLATVPALATRGDVIFADEMNHASLIDGCRLSRAEVQIYPHGDWRALERLLDAASLAGRRLIVTDALFSMDGDLAPLVELADLARRHAAMLMVDEAHATGVFGRSGRGVAEHFGVAEQIDVRVGTLSKALGGVGGFVCGSQPLVQYLVNRARPYIFSTALPAAACAAASAALRIVREEATPRQLLLRNAESLRHTLAAQGWDIGASASQIIPLLIGSAQQTVEVAARLFAAGFYVPAVRPPSVPAGQSRLRLSLSAAHAPQQIEAVVAELARYATGNAVGACGGGLAAE